MQELAFLYNPPEQPAHLKAECADFIVKEELGYEMAGEGEFVALYVRKTDANTLFVGEKLAEFAGISPRNMSYAGLKDRKAITEQWFCLHMAGQETPDFSQFHLDGVEILKVTRHNRKIRTGSLDGNHFEILLRGAQQTDDLNLRLENLKQLGFPNYFTEQRFGRDGHNLTQAMRWAKGEINVKDRKKRSFYLSAARSEIFNLVVSDRVQQQLTQAILFGDIVQLNGSHSWFTVDETEDLEQLKVRLKNQDILLTAPLVGEYIQAANAREMEIVQQHQEILNLMHKERMKPSRRPLLICPQSLDWAFLPEGLKLTFYLPAGCYATALIRELIQIIE
ncbi:tRNA pseudouridine(13) synthase TruD [Avibacterium sp. 20-15]|uniref:tRNA pseudouridine(13) synthase TruD n=1 Tax=unclassified Avibacterium TaxID=2685287 RepID=UPI002026B572|nr:MULTISPECIES: tRNA pseudouridine(13) synthase TruD [unclassified Avibacterium]MCW9733278.1 tRNA pseudouridine(13) synthase TruD [Avibacterium sp. 20-15]URL05394.1 tRNA pseudouridine(13) synthase TruD [Avibacterium sp. 20-132]